ncbi:MAG: hypothetical protein VX899_14340 [Myxococcota bacterium]|nr:hypothetical protein [Myxococcota bacterium]
MIPLLLMACAAPLSPETLALRTCDAMPGLSVDSAGLAQLQGVLDPAELSLLSQNRASGVGFERIGTSGYGVIRANTACAVISADRQGARVRRETPDIRAMDPWVKDEVWELPPRLQELEYRYIETPQGLRTHLGLAEHQARAEQLRQQAQTDPQGAIAGWEALDAELADPMIHFEIQAIQRQQARRAQDRPLSGPQGESTLLAQAGAGFTLILLTGDEEECSGCQELEAHLPELLGARATLLHLHAGEVTPASAWTAPPGWLEPPVLPHLVLLDETLAPTWKWSGYAPQDRAELRAALEDATTP